MPGKLSNSTPHSCLEAAFLLSPVGFEGHVFKAILASSNSILDWATAPNI